LPNAEEPPLEPLLLSVSEAARLLHISRAKAYEMVSAGELPAFEFAGRLKISYEKLRAYIRKRAAG
jgi:excisionase family DNA binding protein